MGSLQDKIEEDNSRHNNSEVRDIDDTLGVTPSEQLSVENLPASNTETVIAGTDKCSGCEMRWNRDCEEWMKLKLLTLDRVSFDQSRGMARPDMLHMQPRG